MNLNYSQLHGEYLSPAKVNLFFRVLSKREDGYHEIATLMQAISFFDRLHISIHQDSNQDILECSHQDIPLDDSNLIIKAIQAFKVATKLNFSCHIKLTKNIPLQAGLGGGSSNAATTLWALNSLLKTNLSIDALMKLGASLGSDVPFFFSSGHAYCTGRGEQILDHSKSQIEPFWIIKPLHDHLSTPLVFKHCKLDEVSSRSPEDLLRNFASHTSYINDLEIPAFKVMPKLLNVKNTLQAMGFSHVMMTGSGSAFICMGSPNQEISKDHFFSCQVQSIFKEADAWY